MPEPGETKADLLGDYLRYVAAMPGPKIAVGWDLDEPAGPGGPVRRGHGDHPPEAGLRGPYHQRLPARPRRSPRPGFPAFRAESVREPCLRPAGRFRLAGHDRRASRSSTGDLIHADKHGVCLIPHQVAPRLAEACAEVERRERPLLEICRSDSFSLEEYIKLRAVSHAKTHE